MRQLLAHGAVRIRAFPGGPDDTAYSIMDRARFTRNRKTAGEWRCVLAPPVTQCPETPFPGTTDGIQSPYFGGIPIIIKYHYK